MHGQGTFNWTDQRQYVGAYVNGMKEGYGKFNDTDGGSYTGYWKAGRQDGKGIHQEAGENGAKHDVEYANGERVDGGAEPEPQQKVVADDKKEEQAPVTPVEV